MIVTSRSCQWSFADWYPRASVKRTFIVLQRCVWTCISCWITKLKEIKINFYISTMFQTFLCCSMYCFLCCSMYFLCCSIYCFLCCSMYCFLCCSMYCFFVLFYVLFFVLFHVLFLCCSMYCFLCCSMYCFCVVLCIFFVLFLCKCVLYYCHWVSTKLQLTNISYHMIFIYSQHYRMHIRHIKI
jgi:hypothetical protein